MFRNCYAKIAGVKYNYCKPTSKYYCTPRSNYCISRSNYRKPTSIATLTNDRLNKIMPFFMHRSSNHITQSHQIS